MTEVQKVILSIYNEVARICDRNNISYYAIGGTCIGAIRHKGFIPWDDDLDIAIPIEHWDKFLSLMQTELPKQYYLYTSDTIKKYHYTFAKICDRNTTFIERSQYNIPKSYKGIYIDVMPLSGFPDNEIERNKFIHKLSLLDRYNKRRRFPETFGTLKGFIFSALFMTIGKLFPFNFFSREYFKVLKSQTFSESQYTGYSWYPEWLPRLVFSKDVFSDGIFVPFEDTQIRVPSDYHSYLSQQFGDYMTIPPEDKRETHDGFVDLSHPFTYYFDKDITKEAIKCQPQQE